MKLGMPTLVEFTHIEDNLHFCSKLDLDFIELNMNLPSCIPENLSHKDILEYKRRYDVDFTIHLPEELDLSSFHNVIRRGHVDRCKEAIHWANRSEISVLNMHLNQGIYFTLPDQKVWIYEKYYEQFKDNLMNSCSELYQYAASCGITLCIENTGNFQLSFVAEVLRELSFMDGFALTWDVGHDAKTGFLEEPIFQKYESRIRHMHLHDFNGKSDHQILYTGHVPIDSRLGFAKKKGNFVVVEVKTASALQKSIDSIRDNWK